MTEESWWILLPVVHEIAGIADILCKSLQGYSTLLCNQHHALKRLVLNINSKVGIVGSLLVVQPGAIREANHQLSDPANYAVSFVAFRGFYGGLGLLCQISPCRNKQREL